MFRSSFPFPSNPFRAWKLWETLGGSPYCALPKTTEPQAFWRLKRSRLRYGEISFPINFKHVRLILDGIQIAQIGSQMFFQLKIIRSEHLGLWDSQTLWNMSRMILSLEQMSVLTYVFVNLDAQNFTGFDDFDGCFQVFHQKLEQEIPFLQNSSLCQKEDQVPRWDSVVECEGSSHKSECIVSNDSV